LVAGGVAGPRGEGERRSDDTPVSHLETRLGDGGATRVPMIPVTDSQYRRNCIVQDESGSSHPLGGSPRRVN
jgi:hypothetical protein